MNVYVATMLAFVLGLLCYWVKTFSQSQWLRAIVDAIYAAVTLYLGTLCV